MTKLLTTAGLIYNKVIWNSYPVGTPFELVGPSTVQLQARAMVHGSGLDSRYVKLAGLDREGIYVTPDEYFKAFTDVHPNCPSITGPFIGRYGAVDIDRLPKSVLAQVSYKVNYPFVDYSFCMNDLYMRLDPEHGPVQINSETLPKDLKVKIPKCVKEISKKVVNCQIHQYIDLTFKGFEVIEDPNW